MLVRTQKRVFLLLDNPIGTDLDPKSYLAGSRLTTLRCPEEVPPHQITAREQEVRRKLIEVAGRAGAVVIDPMSYLCAGDLCPIRDGRGSFIYPTTSARRRPEPSSDTSTSRFDPFERRRPPSAPTGDISVVAPASGITSKATDLRRGLLKGRAGGRCPGRGNRIPRRRHRSIANRSGRLSARRSR